MRDPRRDVRLLYVRVGFYHIKTWSMSFEIVLFVMSWRGLGLLKFGLGLLKFHSLSRHDMLSHVAT